MGLVNTPSKESDLTACDDIKESHVGFSTGRGTSLMGVGGDSVSKGLA